MKNGGGEGRIGFTGAEDFHEVLRAPCTTRGDYRNIHRLRHRTREFAVEALAGAVTVHRSEKDFTGPPILGVSRPLHGIASRRSASAGHKSLKACLTALRVDRHNDRL